MDLKLKKPFGFVVLRGPGDPSLSVDSLCPSYKEGDKTALPYL